MRTGMKLIVVFRNFANSLKKAWQKDTASCVHLRIRTMALDLNAVINLNVQSTYVKCCVFLNTNSGMKSHFWRLYIIQCRNICSVTLHCSLRVLTEQCGRKSYTMTWLTAKVVQLAAKCVSVPVFPLSTGPQVRTCVLINRVCESYRKVGSWHSNVYEAVFVWS